MGGRLSEKLRRKAIAVVALLAAMMLPPTGPASAAPVGPVSDVSLATLRLGDMTARGRIAYLNIYFPGYGDYQLADGSYLQLELDHSPLLRPQDSTLTAVLNNVPVGSLLLTPQNAGRTTWRVNLPASLLAPDTNHVQLRYFMRLQDDDCSNQDNPALYSTLYATSFIHYQYATPPRYITPAPPDLGRFPDPFIRAAQPSADVTFVVPDRPSTADLSAAATVAARIGLLAGSKPVTTHLLTAAAATPQLLSARDLVLVGTPASNPMLKAAAARLPLKPAAGDQPGYLDPSGRPIPPDNGVLQLATSPWDERNTILAVTGASEEGIRRAARALASRLAGQTLQGTWAVVTEAVERQDADTADTASGPAPLTLAKLGMREVTFQGYGSYSTTFTFDSLPPGGSQQVYIDLIISHSPLLDPSRSSVTVSLNGSPVGSIALRPDDSLRRHWRVALPGPAVRPGTNSVAVTFNLYLPRTEGCGPEASERGWATLDPDSTVQLASTTSQPALDISNLPYPFIQHGTPAGSLLVLPDDAAGMEYALQPAVEMGRHSTGPTTEILAATASSLTDEMKASYHLLAYGLPDDNRLIAAAAERLPVALGPGADRSVRGPRSVLLSVRDAANLGVLELVPSPWNADRALLVISGTSAAAVRQAPTALSQRLSAGNVAVVGRDEKGELKSTTMSLPVEAAPTRSTELQVRERFYALASIPAIGVTLLMLGLMLARLTKT